MREFQVIGGGNSTQAVGSIFLAILFTSSLILIMGLDRVNLKVPPQDLLVREVSVSPAPPPPKELQEHRKITPVELPNLKVSHTPSPVILKTPPLDLKLQMELPTQSSLESVSFKSDLDQVVGEGLAKVFKFSELDERFKFFAPKMYFTFPNELLQRGIKKGKVNLLIKIHADGKGTVLSVESADYPQLIPIAKRMFSQIKFTPGKVDGKPVSTQGIWSFPIQAP